MKYIGTVFGTDYVVVSKFEIALGIIAIMVITVSAFLMLIAVAEVLKKRKEYMSTLTDKEFRKYREFKDRL